jgi:hypothetical protein
MNKLPILGFALLLSSSILGQSRIAIGLDIKPQIHSTIGRNNFINSETKRREVSMNLSGGLEIEYLINEKFSIGTGLNYNPQGISKEQLNIDDYGDRYFEANFDYVRIPIDIVFYLPKFDNNKKIFLSAGLGTNLLITVEDNLGEVVDFLNCVCDDSETRYNKLVFDLQMSTGFEYHFTNNLFLLTKLEMLSGISRFHKHYPIGSSTEIEVNSRIISLGLAVGILYRFT